MTVDISVMKHKFVLLDVSQRLPSSTMNEFARRLSVSHERVQQINTDFKRLEERYYQVCLVSFMCIYCSKFAQVCNWNVLS